MIGSAADASPEARSDAASAADVSKVRKVMLFMMNLLALVYNKAREVAGWSDPLIALI